MSCHSLVPKKLQSAMAAGAIALCVVLPAAHAAVVVVVPATPIGLINSFNGLYLNVVTGVFGASGGAVPGYDINPWGNSGLVFFAPATSGVVATGTPGLTAEATALSLGAPITPAAQFNTSVTRGADFQVPGVHFLGFRFFNESTSATNYGWLQISSGTNPPPNAGFPAFITAYGYENAGASITAGAGLVPEPSTWALFSVALAGAAGLRSWKARRAA
jgi:PEP-CTERM motif